MRWRKIIIAALLGGLLAYAGQFLAYYFWPEPYLPSAHTRFGWLTKSLEGYLPQAQLLWWEEELLFWLNEKGEKAARITLIAAFLGASSVLAADQLRKKREAKKVATVS